MASATRRLSKLINCATRISANRNLKKILDVSRPFVQTADLSTLSIITRQHQLAQEPIAERILASTTKEDNCLNLTFTDGSVGAAPFTWLRDNCRCPQCYDYHALGRKSLLQDLDINTKPRNVSQKNGIVYIDWNDGHQSEFQSEWLYDRAFTPAARGAYKSFFKINQIYWGKDCKLDNFDYSKIVSDSKTMLDYLVTLETKGAVLVKNTPSDEDAGPSLIDHIAFVKPSHYGRRSPVMVREKANNIAWTNAELGLHTDLAQYDYQAGIICIHMMQQHIGQGGESVISDGNFCAQIMREKYPKEFEVLTSTDVYFWDKGRRNYYLEMENFYKISLGPVITLDNAGNIIKITMNNAVRDSHMDLPPHKVQSFYEALKLYNDLLYENAHTFKMENGDMLTMDNVRCLHGRQSFESNSGRHIESSYLDWDEARCRRRRLQEKHL